MSKHDERDFPRLALQVVESSPAPSSPARLAQVEVLRDSSGRTKGWLARLDNGTEAWLPDDDEPRLLH